MVGSYLSRLLRLRGIEVDLYGAANGHTVCGIHPCAWGSSDGFHDHLRAAETEPDDYILMRPERVNFEGVDLPATLITFDKPRLIRELQDGSTVRTDPLNPGLYSRIVDATGVKRAMLPKIEGDLIVPCVQHRMRFKARDSSVVAIKYGDVGYSWSFPLSATEFHIGGGSLTFDPRQMVPESGLLGADGERICGCSGAVRTSSPEMSTPFHVPGNGGHPEVVGVGESIGVVAPIAGEGVAPGMASARILVECWDDPGSYTARILKEFRWMRSERGILDKISAGGELGIQDWITLRNTGRRMGAKVGIKDVMTLLGFLSNRRAGR